MRSATLRPRSALRPLRHRDFRLLWTGLVVSNVGTWMQFVAVGYLVDRLTLSPLYLGLLALVQALPRFLFAPVGGALADRWDRKALLFWTNGWLAASALVLAGLTLAGQVQVWHVLALAAMNSAVQSFDMPARHSWIPSLVDADEVLQAVTLNSVAFNGAGIVGPSLGGLVIAWAGEAGCFIFNALSYAAVLLALRLMTTSPPPAAPRASVLTEVAEAAALVRRNRTVAWVLGTVAAVNFLGRPYFRLMPAFAREVLHADAVGLGLLQAAPGLGTLLAPWYVAVGQTRGQGWLLTRSALGLGVCVTLFALSPAFGWAFAFLVAAGLFQSTALSSANALVQTAVDPAMRGRAMGLYSVTAFGMFTLGSFPFGALAEETGTPSALATGGLLTTLLALWVGPRVRRLVDEGGRSVNRGEALEVVRRLVDQPDGAERVVEFLHLKFPHYTWVGIYWLEGDELVLGPWRGPEPTQHTRIPVGVGICGAAAASGRTEVVPDVTQDPRYLSCFPYTRSEIVVPIVRDGRVVGEIDIDSRLPDAFTEEDRTFLEQVAALLSLAQPRQPWR